MVVGGIEIKHNMCDKGIIMSHTRGIKIKHALKGYQLYTRNLPGK